jgi:glyoxylase-like metal-dependent hydrolase (beta-lactamase superfamily II)
MPQVYEDALVTVEALGPLGSLGNNSYIVRPRDGGPALVIDAPEGSEAVVDALGDRAVAAILITHQHRDHWAGLDLLREATDADVRVGPEPRRGEFARDAQVVHSGERIAVGGASVEVIETPGHTPGSVCFRLSGVVFTGDTLFPGGPGRTASNGALIEEIASIRAGLYTLPPATLVLPGHGDTTTIGASRAEYDGFAAREHPADLACDVTWAGS